MSTVEMPEQELLSLEEAAEFLCVSKSTMYRLLEQRKLTGMKAGKLWRFRKEDLLAYMQRGPAALALTKVPAQVLDEELAFLASELVKAGTATDACDDPALEGEPGKVSQLVRRMVWLLYTLKASDLHLNPVWEPEGQSVLFVLRVDGGWREIRRLPSVILDALIIEWKRLAGFAIEERERPQEGSARIVFGALLGNLRVAIIPTIHGEKVSVRHIPTRVPTMADLAIDETPLKEWCRQTHGLLLFVGPTGSGKSTTRAACMQEILTQRPCNMMTVEDPVEFLFPRGVTHLKVEHFSLEEGLRALLQHDPDVIFIGEALHCNPELARLTVESAETGHLVMSVMHAHDAISPLWEYLELGVKRSLLANNLVGIVCQQLAPKPCAACMAPVELEPALLETIRQAAGEGGLQLPDAVTFYNPAGCEACEGRRYKGRVALHEYFTFSPTLRSAFQRNPSMDEFTKLARQEGRLSFFATQAQHALSGFISLETLLRYLPY